MRFVLIGLLTGCGWLPSDSPAAPKAPLPDPDVTAITHAWKVDRHVLGIRTTMSEQDAIALHGRTVMLTSTPEFTLTPRPDRLIMFVPGLTPNRSRTIANLDNSRQIEPFHISEAINYRSVCR